MKYGVLFCFLGILFFPCTGVFQEKELLDILSIDYGEHDKEIKQQKIDSLTLVYEEHLTTYQLAEFYHNLGSKWHYKQWSNSNSKRDLRKAILYTGKAVTLKKSLDTLPDKTVKKSLYNLAVFHSRNDNFFEAIDLYADLTENYEKDYKTILAYLYQGIFNNKIGDFHKALTSFNMIISLHKSETDLVAIDKLIDAYLETAKTYSLMGYEEFETQIEVNISKADSIISQQFSPDNTFDYELLQVNQIRGHLLLKTGRFNKAIDYQKKVVNVLSDPGDLAIVYNSLGLSQLELGDYDDAFESLQKAIAYDPYYTDPYNNLGELYLAKKEFLKALTNFQKAIIYSVDIHKDVIVDEVLTIDDLEVSTEKIPLLNHLVTKANAWMTYYDHDQDKEHLKKALESFSLADQLVDIIRFESTENQSKLFWREKGATLYMKAVEVCYMLNRPKDAFHFMEKNKALLLLEDITNEEAKEIAKLPNAIAKREFDLKSKIHLLENEWHTDAVTPITDKEVLANKITKQKREYEKFVDSLTLTFPEYAVFKKKIAILGYENFSKEYISDDEVVVHYILNDQQGYGLLTSIDQSLFFQLEDPSVLDQDIALLQKDLSKGIKDINTFTKTSNRIFRKLIPDQAYQLIKGKKLTIIPDYTLLRIPFETLIVDKENPRYLIEDVEIRYVYSISHIHLNKQISRTPKKEFIGFAPVDFNGLELNKLIYSKDEIIGAENLYSGDLLSNETATKTSFLNNSADYKIIHLSTHADIGTSGNPWIAFSDSRLFLKEIYGTKNQSDMVVLSGCNTSRGELKKGEGVMSLARGFFYSGTKSVVSSLWSINEKASKDIVIGFYKELDKGQTKSAALRNAKLDFIKKNKENALSPNLWGALILIGDNTTIESSKIFNYYFFLGAFLLLILLFYLKRRR